MTTQTPPPQAKSEMPALQKNLAPSDFSIASDNAQKRGICGIRSRRRTIGAHVITSRTFSLKATTLGGRIAGVAVGKAGEVETTIESVATRVALHPFFAGMSQRQLSLLASCGMAVRFNKGQMIFREGEVANGFYLLETGKVLLESSDGLGDPLFGGSWMFPPHTWNFTARAAEPITALFFHGASLREYCEKDHSLGYELWKRLSLLMYRRIQAARNRMLTLRHRVDPLQPGGTAAVYGAEARG